MFTVGIFTTHLPYVAIVAFYAYFLIFNVDKASDTDVSTESVINIEIDSENFNILPCYYTDLCLTCTKNIQRNATLENHVFKRKLKHPDFIYSHYRHEYFCFSCISRPPPVI